jgi:hypothetical protein
VLNLSNFGIRRATSKEVPFHEFFSVCFWSDFDGTFFYIIYSSVWSRFHRQSSIEYAELCWHSKVSHLSDFSNAQCANAASNRIFAMVVFNDFGTCDFVLFTHHFYSPALSLVVRHVLSFCVSIFMSARECCPRRALVVPSLCRDCALIVEF